MRLLVAPVTFGLDLGLGTVGRGGGDGSGGSTITGGGGDGAGGSWGGGSRGGTESATLGVGADTMAAMCFPSAI